MMSYYFLPYYFYNDGGGRYLRGSYPRITYDSTNTLEFDSNFVRTSFIIVL